MAASSASIGDLIRTSEARNGRPCIEGTGMSVHAVVARYRAGMTPEAMHNDIPDIPVSHFYAALAYYHLNRQQLDRELAEMDAEAERLEREHAGR